MLGKWQAITLWKRVLIGLVLGMAIGLLLRQLLGVEQAAKIGTNWFKPFGDLFIRLIKMLIIPIIATTLVAGVTAMGDPKKLGSLGARTLGLYLLTTFFAVSLGLAMGTIIQPGACLLYTSPSPRDQRGSRMPSSA